jgi:hypothetical protein
MSKAVDLAKQRTPNSVRVVARRAMLEGHNARLRLTVPVVARCGYDNVYHCAMQKTASQWIKALFSDRIVYRHSGLLPYVPRYYKWRNPQPFPTGRAVMSLFISYAGYQKFPKPERYRTFTCCATRATWSSRITSPPAIRTRRWATFPRSAPCSRTCRSRRACFT